MLIAAAALGGCSTVASLNPFGSSSAPAAACPNAVIVQPLAQTAVFAPGRQPEPAGVAYYGVLDDVSSKCDQSGGVLRDQLDIVIIGQRGPAAAGTPGVDLQYFVAVTGPNQAILSKRSLPVHVVIPADAKRGGVTDHIEETIPLAGQNPGSLSIMLGFQQSPQAVEFYKHYRGR